MPVRFTRRALAPAAAGLLVLALGACSTAIRPDNGETRAAGTPSAGAGANGATTSATPAQSQLPQGGRVFFPTYRLVGYSGIAGTGEGLGRAGVGNIDDRMTEMVQRAQPYTADGRKIMPTLEFIATMVQPCSSSPKCRSLPSDDAVQKHLDAVRKVHGILLLGIQPGRSDFLTETKHYEKFLEQPDVGVALDPEWRMQPGQEPMQSFGSTSANELNEVSGYLDKLVADNGLPQKVMLYHMIRTNWVRHPDQLVDRSNLAMIVSVDGIGSQKMKLDTWKAIMGVRPPFVHPGFKLFYQEDAARPGWKLMTPQQVMALNPRPEYVLYE